MKTETIRIRTEPELKAQAEALFEELGLNTSTAVNMFFKQAIRERKLPFQSTLTASSLEDAPDWKRAAAYARSRAEEQGLTDEQIEQLVSSL